jgi:cell wall assembly regulator SMI1
MKSARDVSALLKRLDRWLARQRPRFFAGLKPGATKAELADLEKQLGRSLPKDLRSLLAWHNGQSDDFVGRFEQDWLLMSCQRIAAAKAELDRDAARWNASWIPFLDNDAGDYLCLDNSQAIAPVNGFWLGETNNEVVAPSLGQWLQDFVENVEKGSYVEDPERGSFVRAKG